MAIVLIVSRTRMSGGNVCVGGLDVSNQKSVRLLTSSGLNQPSNSPYQVGDFWDLKLAIKPKCIPPHHEDVLVLDATKASPSTNIQNTIRQFAKVHTGLLSLTFQNALVIASGKAWYIERETIPPYSVCFWETPTDLTYTNNYDKSKYHYLHKNEETYLPFVGTANPIPIITSGTIIRLSLARWWTPPGQQSDHCYLQLSGWY